MSGNKSTAVMLVNLGTPEEPSTKSVRAFLREFLSDRRVVEIPRAIWWVILYCFILPFRPVKVAELYKQIWWENGSPMRVILANQAAALQKMLEQAGKSDIKVLGTMTYGEPSFVKNVANLVENHDVEKLIILPLYPQYSATTTAAVWDQLAKTLATMRNIPEIVFIKDYHDHPAYISALCDSITEVLDKQESVEPESQRLVFSFHGIPQMFADKGDPYPKHCEKTVELVMEKLNRPEINWQLAYQSRLGNQAWLQPYLDEYLESAPEKGVKHINILSPAFSSDCLETLEEIAGENKKLFLDNGGKSFQYIAALNDRDEHIDMMKRLVLPYLI